MYKKEKITSLLRSLGFNDAEISVYLYLLERATSLSVTDIARGTGSHRPVVYKALDRLQEKGLITVQPKGKRKHYRAEHPDKLRQVYQDLQFDLEETLPDLEEMYQAPEEKPIVKFYEGKEGITSIYNDIVNTLKRGGVMYRYSSTNDINSSQKYLPKDYRKKRDNKNIERYVIRNEGTNEQKSPDLNRNTKVVPQDFDLFDQNIIQFIYDSKVAIVDMNTETSFVIENEKFATFQERIFSLLYSRL